MKLVSLEETQAQSLCIVYFRSTQVRYTGDRWEPQSQDSWKNLSQQKLHPEKRWSGLLYKTSSRKEVLSSLDFYIPLSLLAVRKIIVCLIIYAETFFKKCEVFCVCLCVPRPCIVLIIILCVTGFAFIFFLHFQRSNTEWKWKPIHQSDIYDKSYMLFVNREEVQSVHHNWL